MMGIKVLERNNDNMLFMTSVDSNVYKYDIYTENITKVMSTTVGNFGKAVRGKKREQIKKMAKYTFENCLPMMVEMEV